MDLVAMVASGHDVSHEWQGSHSSTPHQRYPFLSAYTCPLLSSTLAVFVSERTQHIPQKVPPLR